MKIPGRASHVAPTAHALGNLLSTICKSDPAQENPLTDPALEQRMIGLLVGLMEFTESPAEQYERLGLAV